MLTIKLLDLINNLIKSDIKNLSLLCDLQNTLLNIEIPDLNLKKSIFFSKSGLSLANDASKKFSSICIQGNLQSFLSLLISKDPKRASQQGLIFEGDAKALHSLQHLLFNLSIDWEAILLSYVDEVTWLDPKLSHAYLHTLKQFLAPITRLKKNERQLETLSISVSDYIQDEKNWIPARNEIEDFIQAVDHTRSAVERCEARINALMLNAKYSESKLTKV